MMVNIKKRVTAPSSCTELNVCLTEWQLNDGIVFYFEAALVGEITHVGYALLNLQFPGALCHWLEARRARRRVLEARTKVEFDMGLRELGFTFFGTANSFRIKFCNPNVIYI